MSNVLDANGLQIKTLAEIVTSLEDALKLIYGSDINVDSDTPDGQCINIFAQSVLDNLELLVQIYNSFDPDNAIGTVLDQRVAINGIQRQAGTYSTSNITIVTSQAVTLYGKDQTVENVYTVADEEGTEWELIETEIISAAGTSVLAFQAADLGSVLSVPNTITRPVSVVLGVTSINNPTVQTLIGTNEETDAALRLRRQKSVSLSSQGFKTSLVAALLNVTGITDAYVYENNTSSIDANGIPAHSIWAIVAGIYEDEDVATAIYQKRNAGCGTFGDETYNITQIDGSLFEISWSNVETIDLFVKMEVEPIDGVTAVDYDAIREELPEKYIPTVYETVNANKASSYVQESDENALITDMGFCATVDGTYESILEPSNKDKQFLLSEANVIILPLLVIPSSDTIESEDEIAFVAKGGYGDYAWTIETNNSGGSIVEATGAYTAGVGTGTDTIRATDEEGNYTDVEIVVE